MNLTVRSINKSEVEQFRQSVAQGFGSDPHADDAERFAKVHEVPRTVAAFDGDDIIGTGGAFTFDVTIPGGALPMAGTTIITVLPTHRRRGVLTAMMRHHLADVRKRGEPLAGLWASESSIYSRFGYGRTVEAHRTTIDGRTVEFLAPAPPGSVRLVAPADALTTMRAVHERIRPTRPGMLTRSDSWWEHRVLGDPEHWRQGKTSKRFAIYHGDSGDIEGYCIYRQKEKWDEFPDSTVHVVEVLADTPAAHHALWRFLLRIDLYPNVDYWNLPPDDALPWLIADSRRVVRSVSDSMWIRILDVPAALSARAYPSDGEVVLGIDDPFLPDISGSYALSVKDGGGQCGRTDAPVDLSMPIDVLGALYFGGHRSTTLARAGLVAGSPDALATFDRIFAWHTSPWCAQVF